MQPISPELREAIKLIFTSLLVVDQPWAFTGSLGMALQGVNLKVGDIDIQTNRPGAYQIQDRLSEFIICKVRYVESENIRSHLGKFRIHNFDVEVIGNIEKRLPDGTWMGPPDLPSLIQFVYFDELRVPVVDLNYEKEAYRILGRIETDAVLEDFMQKRDAGNEKSAQ